MIEATNDKKRNVFLNVLFGCVLVAIGVSFYNFYFKKNYDFIVETPCDTESEICFYRDCENNPDICPPNELSYYNQFTIRARDFKYCKDENCKDACKSGEIKCVETMCTGTDIEDGMCVLPANYIN